jgi:hypothetical protein
MSPRLKSLPALILAALVAVIVGGAIAFGADFVMGFVMIAADAVVHFIVYVWKALVLYILDALNFALPIIVAVVVGAVAANQVFGRLAVTTKPRRTRRIRPPRPRKIRSQHPLPEWLWWLLWILLLGDLIATCVLIAVLGQGDFTRLAEIAGVGVLPMVIVFIGAWLYEAIPWSIIGRRIQRWFGEINWRRIRHMALALLIAAICLTLLYFGTPGPTQNPATKPLPKGTGTAKQPNARKVIVLPDGIVYDTDAYDGNYSPVMDVDVLATTGPIDSWLDFTVQWVPVWLTNPHTGRRYYHVEKQVFSYVAHDGSPAPWGVRIVKSTDRNGQPSWTITYRIPSGKGQFRIGFHKVGSFGQPYFWNMAGQVTPTTCPAASVAHFGTNWGTATNVNLAYTNYGGGVVTGSYLATGESLYTGGLYVVPSYLSFNSIGEPYGSAAVVYSVGGVYVIHMKFTPTGISEKNDLSKTC